MTELLMIPKNMQKEVIRHVHNKGHYAVAKTGIILKENCYIPQLRKQIENLLSNNCIECILCNKKQGKSERLLNKIPKETIHLKTHHVDHIDTMLPTNKNSLTFLPLWTHLLNLAIARENIRR